MTAARPVPAYFVGRPTLYKVNDEAEMLVRADGDLHNFAQLGRGERTTLYRKIS